jgi:acyl carrier protein
LSASDLQTSVLAVLRRTVPVAPADIDPEKPFRDQFEMDSLDFLNFVLALEKEHGVSIPPVRYPLCATLAGATDVLGKARVTETA